VSDASDSEEQPPWRPLSERRRESSSYAEVLHEGVPAHLRDSLAFWVRGAVELLSISPSDLQLRVTRLLRRPGNYIESPEGLEAEQLLDLVDVLLMLLWEAIEAVDNRGRDPFVRHAFKADDFLAESGSAWRIRFMDGRLGLARRVDETATARADRVSSDASSTSAHLRRAWEHLYQRRPEYSQALDEAVFALEAATRSVGASDDEETLGTVIEAMLAEPSTWTCDLGTVETVAVRLSAIWTRQQRHRTDDANSVEPETPAVAEAAVHDALTLVHWFQIGVVRRSDSA